jgi:uncharacterized protein involved in outer membrane biogenesis
MSKRKRVVLACAAICAVLFIFNITILPAIVKSRAVEAIQKMTGRPTRLESLSINPLTLTVSAGGFTMDERGGRPFISIGAVRASLSPASIYRRALVLSRVQIERPAISITRTGPNRYSFSDIQERLQTRKKTEQQKQGDETRFSINNITVRGGSVDFNDQAVSGGKSHTIRSLEIGIPFISNIPYLVERYTAPRISAVVDGAPFSFAGKMKPFSRSMESSVRIDLKRLDLPRLAAYYPRTLAAELTSGKLTVGADVKYRVFSDRKPELVISGLVRLDDTAIAMKDGRPLVRLPLLEVRASRLEFLARLFQFQAIRVDGLELFVNRDRGRKWMFERLLTAEKRGKERKAAATQSKTEGKPRHPSVRISSFALANSSIHYSDAVATGGFRGSLSRINLTMKNLDTAPEKSAEYELSFLADQNATLTSRGNISFTPLTVKSSTTLKGLSLLRGWPYLAEQLTTPVRGTMDLSTDLAYSGEKGLTTENGVLALRQLSTRFGTGDGLNLALLSIKGASYRQKENSLNMDEFRVAGGSISVSRESDGSVSLSSLFRKREGAAPHATPAAERRTPPSRPFSYRLKRFQTERLNLAFTDRSREEKPRFTLRNTGISLSNLNGPRFTPEQLNVSATYGKKSPIRVKGEITPLPFRFRGTVRVGRLPITDFEDYFPDNLNLYVVDGYLDSSLGVDISLKNGKPSGTFRGNAGVRSFHSVDAEAEEDLLKWESLQLDQFQGRLEPFSLSIRQIALNGVYSRIIVRRDGTLNLQNLVEPPAPPATAGQKVAPAAAAASKRVPATKRQISIGAVTIQEGTVAFSDNHLPQQFSSTFHNLGGRISGMSSDDSRFADVDLRGNLENRSPLQITGTINPLRDDLFVDLKVSFRDIELSPTTPYSGTYLGYSVERGKLFLDLKYHIEQKELRSENRIFIDQFTFGNRVESKQATRLPVRLGLALLKDRRGEIHLDVPVTGRTDDPQFSIWRLVFQVMRNLLVKAATSPFSLLSSLFGGGADLSTIQFDKGSSTLSAGEEQKLGALAKALSDRPALKMEVKGYVDREKDAEGYRRELLNRKILNEKTLSLAKQRRGEGDIPVQTATLQPEEYSRYLKAVYRREKFPKPRNVFGLVKELPDEEMKKLIIANTVVGDQELHALSQERSAAVMAYLVKQGVTAERIFLKKDDINRLPEKSGQERSRVELNAIAQ